MKPGDVNVTVTSCVAHMSCQALQRFLATQLRDGFFVPVVTSLLTHKTMYTTCKNLLERVRTEFVDACSFSSHEFSKSSQSLLGTKVVKNDTSAFTHQTQAFTD